jgi:hypothetical protein
MRPDRQGRRISSRGNRRALVAWIFGWTGSSLVTKRLSLTAEQRNSRSRAYANASCSVLKRMGSPTHSPESSTITSTLQDMFLSLANHRPNKKRSPPPRARGQVLGEMEWCHLTRVRTRTGCRIATLADIPMLSTSQFYGRGPEHPRGWTNCAVNWPDLRPIELVVRREVC